MARYIDADALLKNLPEDLPYKASVKRVLIQAPDADVVEVRHGEWVEDELTYCGAGRCNYKCTVCGEMISAARRETTEHLYPYCPFCGARMKGDKNDKSSVESNI